jgi:hypothetical protein
MAECYHRSASGKVVWIEMTRDEVETAVARAPHEWSLNPRGFSPWPAHAVRGEPVPLPSTADWPQPRPEPRTLRETAANGRKP